MEPNNNESLYMSSNCEESKLASTDYGSDLNPKILI